MPGKLRREGDIGVHYCHRGSEDPGNPYGTFAFDEADYLCNRIFGRYAYKGVYVVCLEISFDYLALFLHRQFLQNGGQFFPELPIERFLPVLRYPHYMIFAIPSGVF
jgi:hypothetical protein